MIFGMFNWLISHIIVYFHYICVFELNYYEWWKSCKNHTNWRKIDQFCKRWKIHANQAIPCQAMPSASPQPACSSGPRGSSAHVVPSAQAARGRGSTSAAHNAHACGARYGRMREAAHACADSAQHAGECRAQRADECGTAAARSGAAEATSEGEKLGSRREKLAEGKEAEGKTAAAQKIMCNSNLKIHISQSRKKQAKWSTDELYPTS